jgi:hypothetical protein
MLIHNSIVRAQVRQLFNKEPERRIFKECLPEYIHNVHKTIDFVQIDTHHLMILREPNSITINNIKTLQTLLVFKYFPEQPREIILLPNWLAKSRYNPDFLIQGGRDIMASFVGNKPRVFIDGRKLIRFMCREGPPDNETLRVVTQDAQGRFIVSTIIEEVR